MNKCSLSSFLDNQGNYLLLHFCCPITWLPGSWLSGVNRVAWPDYRRAGLLRLLTGRSDTPLRPSIQATQSSSVELRVFYATRTTTGPFAQSDSSTHDDERQPEFLVHQSNSYNRLFPVQFIRLEHSRNSTKNCRKDTRLIQTRRFRVPEESWNCR